MILKWVQTKNGEEEEEVVEGTKNEALVRGGSHKNKQ
jgi:hypothetical protein